MNDKEKPTPKLDITDYQIPGQEHLELPKDGESEQQSTATRGLGETAIRKLGSDKDLEQSQGDFFDSITKTEDYAERNGYVAAGPVEHRIFEPTDAPGSGGIHNRLAHLLIRYQDEDLIFVKIDGGYQPFTKPLETGQPEADPDTETR